MNYLDILSYNKLLPPIYNVIKKCAVVTIHLMTAVHNIKLLYYKIWYS